MFPPRASLPDGSKKNQAVEHYKPHLDGTFLRIGLIVIVGLAILVALYSVYWFVVAAHFKGSVIPWLQERVGKESQVSYQRIEISGYPANFRITLRGLSVTAHDIPFLGVNMGWNWKTSRAITVVRPWDFDSLHVVLSGNHDVSVNASKGLYRYTGVSNSLVLGLEIFNDGLPELATLVATCLDIAQDGTNQKFSSRNLSVKAQRLFPDLISSETPTLNIRFEIDDFSLPTALRLPLGGIVKNLNVSINLLAKLGRPFDIIALSKWRDAGGIIEFGSIEARYGPLYLLANGTLALDDKLQILAALSVKVQGIFSVIDRLKNAQVIRARDAAFAKLVIGVFSERSPVGGPATISLPLTIQDGKLSIQNLTLLNIPEIRWPKPIKSQEDSRRVR